MSSWRVRFFRVATRVLIRRRNWGDPQTLAGRARRLLDGIFHGWQMLDGVVSEARDALAGSARFIHTLTTPGYSPCRSPSTRG